MKGVKTENTMMEDGGWRMAKTKKKNLPPSPRLPPSLQQTERAMADKSADRRATNQESVGRRIGEEEGGVSPQIRRRPQIRTGSRMPAKDAKGREIEGGIWPASGNPESLNENKI